MEVGDGVLRIDAEKDRATFDYGTNRRSGVLHRRLSWDGTAIRYADSEATSPIVLPTEYAERWQQVYDELLAGAPHLTLIAEVPASGGGGAGASPVNRNEWYRVDTPWTWDDNYNVFVSVAPNTGELARLTIEDVDGKPVRVHSDFVLERVMAATGTATWNVPLHPDIASPAVADAEQVYHRPQRVGARNMDTHPPFHHASRRMLFEKTGSEEEAVAVLRHECSSGGTEAASPVDMQWVVPANDGDLQRLADARAQCDGIAFRMGMNATVSAPEGSHRACYSGTWTLFDDATSPPTAVVARNVDGCVSEAVDHVPYRMVRGLDAQQARPTLRVSFQGNLNVACQAPTPVDAYVQLDFTARRTRAPFEGTPLLQWDCWPGWDMRDVHDFYPQQLLPPGDTTFDE